MGAGHNNRLWLLGGVVAIVVIVAATFLLAIKPIYTEKAELQDQAEDQGIQLVELRHQLSDLETQAKNSAAYEAQLATKDAALPEKYELTNYLRDLQTSEKSVTVSVDSVGISEPKTVSGSTSVYSVPVSLTVSGKPAAISKVIKRLQTVQSRAALITSVNLNVTSESAATASITLNTFCRKSAACVVAG
jgi:Tfp pilus assembly protein PilO